jgi:hypothetical protein
MTVTCLFLHQNGKEEYEFHEKIPYNAENGYFQTFPPGNKKFIVLILIPFLLVECYANLNSATHNKTSQSRFILIGAIVVAPRSLFYFGAISQCAYHSPTGMKKTRAKKPLAKLAGKKLIAISFLSLPCV